MDGTQLATLEVDKQQNFPLFHITHGCFTTYTLPPTPHPTQAKTSADMGHWLGLLLSQTGSKTDPEELMYDYVNAERISSIVAAAKTSL